MIDNLDLANDYLSIVHIFVIQSVNNKPNIGRFIRSLSVKHHACRHADKTQAQKARKTAKAIHSSICCRDPALRHVWHSIEDVTHYCHTAQRTHWRRHSPVTLCLVPCQWNTAFTHVLIDQILLVRSLHCRHKCITLCWLRKLGCAWHMTVTGSQWRGLQWSEGGGGNQRESPHHLLVWWA